MWRAVPCLRIIEESRNITSIPMFRGIKRKSFCQKAGGNRGETSDIGEIFNWSIFDKREKGGKKSTVPTLEECGGHIHGIPHVWP